MPTKGAGRFAPVFPSVSFAPSSPDSTSRSQVAEGQYDKVNFSRESSGTDQFQRELVSRLVREVRTVHTASDIQQIKTEVNSGYFKPDANEIATKLLLEANTCGND
jgi:anti-sigma28 factor (negative regulator of flagellin synthesis)